MILQLKTKQFKKRKKERKNCFAHMATRPGVRGLRKRGLWVPGARRVRGHQGELVPRATCGRRMGQRPLPLRGEGCRWAGGRAPRLEAGKACPTSRENKSEEVRGLGAHFRNRQSGFHLLDHHTSSWAPRPWNLNTGVTPRENCAWHWRVFAIRLNDTLSPSTPGREGIPDVTTHASSVLSGAVTSWERVSVLRGKGVWDLPLWQKSFLSQGPLSSSV